MPHPDDNPQLYDLPDSTYRLDFDRANDPAAWVLVAENLLAGSIELMNLGFTFDIRDDSTFSVRSGLLTPAQLLAAFALENYLKAVRVRQLVSNGEKAIVAATNGVELHPHLRGHNLLQLARLAGQRRFLGPLQTQILARFTRIGVWSGRYPIPLPNQPAIVDRSINTQDWNVIHSLAMRLQRRSLLAPVEALRLDELFEQERLEEQPKAAARVGPIQPRASDQPAPEWADEWM